MHTFIPSGALQYRDLQWLPKMRMECNVYVGIQSVTLTLWFLFRQGVSMKMIMLLWGWSWYKIKILLLCIHIQQQYPWYQFNNTLRLERFWTDIGHASFIYSFYQLHLYCCLENVFCDDYKPWMVSIFALLQ